MTYFTCKDLQRAKTPKGKNQTRTLSFSTTIAQNAVDTYILDLKRVNNAFNDSMKRHTHVG